MGHGFLLHCTVRREESEGRGRTGVNVKDEYCVWIFVLTAAGGRDVFTAAQRCSIHLYRQNGAVATAAGLLS